MQNNVDTDVSIIMCTYNRAANLAECVACLEKQHGVESIHWEVVLVDNNSNDSTKRVVSELQANSSVEIRYVFEGEQGLSAARNRGIQEANGRYLIFIDDDIHVQPQWLSSIYDTFERNQCSAVGGRIHLEKMDLLPAWIEPDMYGFLGYRDFGDDEFQMDGKREFPFGGNMAMARDAIELVGGFDTRMGRKGEGKKKEELFKGEETDFFHRLTAAGETIYYAPDAIVIHKILPHQLTKKFFRTLHYNAGYQKALLEGTVQGRSLAGVPLFIYRQTMNAQRKYLVKLFTSGNIKAFRYQMSVGYMLGMIKGYMEIHRH